MGSTYPYGASDPSIYDNDEGWHDYDDYPDPRECDHTEYDSDILTGMATCADCGHRWVQSSEEIGTEYARIRAWDEWQREQERPWNRFKTWIADKISNARWRWRMLWKPKPLMLDDEIPF